MHVLVERFADFQTATGRGGGHDMYARTSCGRGQEDIQHGGTLYKRINLVDESSQDLFI